MGTFPIPASQGIPLAPNLFAATPLALPAGWPPDVHPLDVIESDHINSIRNSVALWPGDVDAQGHLLSNVRLAGIQSITFTGPLNMGGQQIQNATFDTASKTAAQTPWVAHIDGNVKNVTNAGTLLAQSHRASSNMCINLDVTSKHIGTGPALVLQYDANQVFIGFAPSAAPGTAYAPTTYPLSFSAAETAIGYPGHPNLNLRAGGTIESYVNIRHTWNAYHDGANIRYRVAYPATCIMGDSAGNIYFQVAPTGTVGAVITWTDRFIIGGLAGAGDNYLQGQTLNLAALTADSPSYLAFRRGGAIGSTVRWVVGVSAGGATQDFNIIAYDNAGTFVANPLSISRASGVVTIPNLALSTAANLKTESGAMVYQTTGGAVHRFYTGATIDGGASDTMQIGSAGIRVRNNNFSFQSSSAQLNVGFLEQTGKNRWTLAMDNTTVGDLILYKYDNNGANPSSMLGFQRSTGRITGGAFLDNLTVSGATQMGVYFRANNGIDAVWSIGVNQSAPDNFWIARYNPAGTFAEYSLAIDRQTGLATFARPIAITNPAPPATNGAAGVQGTITWDANFLYVCVLNNTWKRVALTTW